MIDKAFPVFVAVSLLAGSAMSGFRQEQTRQPVQNIPAQGNPAAAGAEVMLTAGPCNWMPMETARRMTRTPSMRHGDRGYSTNCGNGAS